MNGDSSIVLDVGIHRLKYRSGSISSKDDVGSWSVEQADTLKLNTGMQLTGMAAKTVYKIVTVLVDMNNNSKEINFL